MSKVQVEYLVKQFLPIRQLGVSTREEIDEAITIAIKQIKKRSEERAEMLNKAGFIPGEDPPWE